MSQNRCAALRQAGTAVWLDQLSREILREGKLTDLIQSAALSGVTSNPAIFHKAMTSGKAYDEQIESLRPRSLATEELYEHLAVFDIQMACDALRPVFDETKGADGFVSLEVSPHLARDAEGSVAAARRLHAWVDRPNLLIKIPGTPEGIPAIGRLLEEGIPVNVTLLFSVEAYEKVAETYIEALQKRAAAGKAPGVASVASFFVSRIDTLVDQHLERIAGGARGDAAQREILSLRGRAAVANAKIAYRSFQSIFGGERVARLRKEGARVQRPLWASTSTKNPDYPDVLYVEPLIGADTVNTMPLETLMAFQDHGRVEPDTVTRGLDEARQMLRKLEEVGVSFRQVTDQLLAEGIEKFNQPYDRLLQSLEERRRR